MTVEERLTNRPTSELWGEHRARYRFALQYARVDRVLDVATGAGFGLQMLDRVASIAFGVDLDVDALNEARRLDRGARLVRADAARLPLPDGSIDLVTSFETLEHVPNAEFLVAELRRVLRAGGRLVLSTPNRAFGPPERHQNPFHVREFTADELLDLLHACFSDVQLYAQRPSDAYRYVPYLMLDRHLEPREIAWKALNRLPFKMKNGVARTVSGRPFYPGETDYFFVRATPDDLRSCHVLVAVAT
ncbi:MAG: class I SAM-dependent methyltransferase [Chloroflexi bacterium]|nr:class I SAM-dependent methyltransferase [Chloroflexota bacterium]